MPQIGKIRLLSAADVPAGLELSVLAGWNQTADDWRILLQLAPEGCFGLEIESRVVATGTLICYGKRLAWIGMVLTHPEFRGRGFAKRLFEHMLQRADAAGIRTLKLDATEQGQPLYEQCDFRSEQAIERWAAELSSMAATDDGDCIRHRQLDAKAFGVDRCELLRSLATRGNCISNDGGYLMTRPGRIASYLGPFVARDRESAKDLLSQFAQQPPELTNTLKVNAEAAQPREWYWDLLPENGAAVELATTLGFTPKRKLTRMIRGENSCGRDELIYAIAGFEVG